MTKTQSKTFSFGKISLHGKRKIYLVELTINLDYDEHNRPVFSATGNVWNSKKTDSLWGGQCLDEVYKHFSHQLKNMFLYTAILGLWRRNHLNDMVAGTPLQEKYKEEFIKETGKYDYDQFVNYLESKNALIDNGYRYGSAWLYREISEDDLLLIKKLLND